MQKDDHLSRTTLSRPSHSTNPDIKERAIPSSSMIFRRAEMSFFGLSPSGVCQASFVASGPVVFYTRHCRLCGCDCPHLQLKINEDEDRRFTLTPFCNEAVYFLWHFPSRFPLGKQSFELQSALPSGARTFLFCKTQKRSSRKNISKI